MSKTDNWKNSERHWARTLQKYKVPAKRISRGSNYSISTYDVEVENHPEIISDSKYSQSRPFRISGLLREIKNKYCKNKNDLALLYTRNYKEHGGLISMDEVWAAKLISVYFCFATREEVENISNE